MKRIGLLLIVALAVSASAASAVADCCGLGGYYGYSSYSHEYIPYFSQHPPVYYSYPVPRTYGWSPYAYPPGTMTPELELPTAPTPTTIRNPYFKPKAAAAEGTASTGRTEAASVAVRFVNPFVKEAGDLPAAKLAEVRSTH